MAIEDNLADPAKFKIADLRTLDEESVKSCRQCEIVLSSSGAGDKVKVCWVLDK